MRRWVVASAMKGSGAARHALSPTDRAVVDRAGPDHAGPSAVRRGRPRRACHRCRSRGIRPLEAAKTLKEPAESRVYQRDENDLATIPVVLADDLKDAEVVSARIFNLNNPSSVGYQDGKLVGVPTGGPYQVSVEVKVGGETRPVNVGHLYVGDLWVLAGQSNMEGVGDLGTSPRRTTGSGCSGWTASGRGPRSRCTGSSTPPTRSTRATLLPGKRSAEQHKTRPKGAGLGLPFAVAIARATRRPHRPGRRAHGGTSMAQWDPAKKDEGGKSLYGSMLRQVNLAGGKVKGVLWYQGESDANDQAAAVYPKVFADFISAVRPDFGQPDLPFYLVQIGRLVRRGDPKAWKRRAGGPAPDPRPGPEHGRRLRRSTWSSTT